MWPHGLCNLPGSSVHEDSPGKNTGVGCHALLQGIFPTQGSNPGLLHCSQILPSEPPGKPKNTRVGSLSLLQGIFPTQELNWGLLHCRQILYQLNYQGSPKLQYLPSTGLVALQHVESSQTRDPTRVPCVGRQIPKHWMIKKFLCCCAEQHVTLPHTPASSPR